jgi:hypothetical protein
VAIEVPWCPLANSGSAISYAEGEDEDRQHTGRPTLYGFGMDDEAVPGRQQVQHNDRVQDPEEQAAAIHTFLKAPLMFCEPSYSGKGTRRSSGSSNPGKW